MSADLCGMVDVICAARAADDDARAIKALADAGYRAAVYGPLFDAIMTAARWQSSRAGQCA
jgi:hypothetical protein